MTKRNSEGIYIPQRFQKEIALHIFKNYYANVNPNFYTPLILAISGPPGVGKTYQAKRVLENIGVDIFTISGAEFENENAGIPVKNMINIYKSISDDVFDKCIKFGAIVIDDIDAALGQWGGLVQYTMNRQLIIKTLIDLADNPYELTAIDDDDRFQRYKTCRVPLIVTLNDETKMYEPLMRNGRTNIFPWIPTEEEISEIIKHIFTGVVFSDFDNSAVAPMKLYMELLAYAKHNISPDIKVLPISLFSDIKSALFDEELWQEINSLRTFDSIAESFNKKWQASTVQKLSKVINIGKDLLHQNKNYLNI